MLSNYFITTLGRLITVGVLISSTIACGQLIKNGSLVEAQEALLENDYEGVLEYTNIAESFGSPSDAERAKLHYLRAQAYEKLNQTRDAQTHYRIVMEHYSTSVYAPAAKGRLVQLQ